MPRVTVIVPVYNKEMFISRCVESIIHQSMTDWELILVDDCSSDNSLSVMNDYAKDDDRIIVRHQKENHGPMIARRLGDEMAKGDYITYCDADDYLPSSALQTLYDEAIRTGADIVSGNHEYFMTDGTRKKSAFSLRYGNDRGGVFKSLLNKQMCHNLWSKLFCSSLLKNYNYEVIDQMANAEDAYMFYQIMLNIHKMVHLPDIVYNYVQTPGSSTQSKYSERALENICMFVSLRMKYMSLFPDLESDIVAYVSAVLVNLEYKGYAKRDTLKQLLINNDLLQYSSIMTIIRHHSLLTAVKLLAKKEISFVSFFVGQPRFLLICLLRKTGFWLQDGVYLQMLYYLKTGSRLNLRYPQTFGEKIQWLKLYDRKLEYTKMVDKYAVKSYVAELIGKEYVIPTLGVWDKPEDIAFESLPQQFVLKTTHGGGGSVVICKDKDQLDKENVVKKLHKELKRNIYDDYREWPYKRVRRRIIAELYIENQDNSNKNLTDYKFYCFNGVPKYCQVIKNRRSKETIDFFDMEWLHQEFYGLNPKARPAESVPVKPKHFEKMKEIARKLSTGLVFSRIDLYDTIDGPLFGEITFYPASGMGTFTPNKYNYILGEMINLPS